MLGNILVIGRSPGLYKVHRNSSKSLILFPGRGISFWCFSLKSDSSIRLNTGELSVNNCLCTCSLKPSTTRMTSDGLNIVDGVYLLGGSMFLVDSSISFSRLLSAAIIFFRLSCAYELLRTQYHTLYLYVLKCFSR